MSVWRTQVRINSPSLGGVGTNTFHFRCLQGDLASETLGLQGASDGLESFYTDLQVNLAGLSTLRHDGTWQEVGVEESRQIEVSGWTFSPTTGGNPLPPANALVIGWRAAGGGRSGRGRTFLGPMSVNTLQSDGTPTEAARTDVETAASELIADFAGAGDGSFCVWSPTDDLARDFVSASVRNEYGVLRSRRD